MILSIIIFIILGFLAGLIAKWFLPGPDAGGFIITTLLGIVGAILGGFIGRLLGYPMADSVSNLSASLVTFIFSVIGAVVVLVIYRLLTGRSLRA